MEPTQVFGAMAVVGAIVLAVAVILACRPSTRSYAVPILVVSSALGAAACIGAAPRNYLVIFAMTAGIGATVLGILTVVARAIVRRAKAPKHAV